VKRNKTWSKLKDGRDWIKDKARKQKMKGQRERERRKEKLWHA
jgi:hypothetical protein